MIFSSIKQVRVWDWFKNALLEYILFLKGKFKKSHFFLGIDVLFLKQSILKKCQNAKTLLRFRSIVNVSVHLIWISNPWVITFISKLTPKLNFYLFQEFSFFFFFFEIRDRSNSFLNPVSLCLPLPFALFPSPCSLGWHCTLGLGPTRPKEHSFHYGLLWCQIEVRGFWNF